MYVMMKPNMPGNMGPGVSLRSVISIIYTGLILLIILSYLIRVSSLNCTVKPKSPAVWACLGVDPLDMPRTPYRASEGKRSQ